MKSFRPGVLNKVQVIKLNEDGIVRNINLIKVDYSAFDLHISNEGYHLKGCVKPQSKYDITELYPIFQKNKLHFEDTISLNQRETYIFKLEESIDFTDQPFWGQATGKSTYGRLDILTRLLTNRSDSYDTIRKGDSGSLWIEVTPITFPIKIKKGMSLNQLRIFKGIPAISRIDNEQLSLWGDLIFDENGNPIRIHDESINLTLNLNEDPNLKKGICAYGAGNPDVNKEPGELDLTKDPDPKSEFRGYPASDYWEKLTPTVKKPLALEINPERFYILRSKERFKLPASVAVYCQAVTENLGELRIHYAGFVHPFFGDSREDGKGAPLIFEVRGHNVKTFLQHGETLARLEYYYMSQDASKENKPSSSKYSDQELTLSKYFYED